MTFFSVVNAERVTLATDSLVIPAAEVEPLSSAIDAATSLSTLHETMEARVLAAEKEGYATGHRNGSIRGQAEAADALSERLLELEHVVEREREVLRARAVDNALGIVRRIAAAVGEHEMLAALALTAAQELMPTAAIVLHVHPDHVDAVRLRLDERQQDDDHGVTLLVEAEASLETGQCRLRAANGTTVLAGLETQLQRLERQASDVPAAEADVPDGPST